MISGRSSGERRDDHGMSSVRRHIRDTKVEVDVGATVCASARHQQQVPVAGSRIDTVIITGSLADKALPAARRAPPARRCPLGLPQFRWSARVLGQLVDRVMNLRPSLSQRLQALA